MLWLLWVRARHPGPFSGSMSVEVFNVGGWLTHGDLALETDVDFLAVVEHRLVPARVRGEWARLRARGASSIWSPASQESSHVGHGGVGVVSLRCAPLSLPTSMDQPCLIVGDFNVEPTKIPCLSKGIFAGLWVDLESAWAFASGVSPAVTCKRTWSEPAGAS